MVREKWTVRGRDPLHSKLIDILTTRDRNMHTRNNNDNNTIIYTYRTLCARGTVSTTSPPRSTATPWAESYFIIIVIIIISIIIIAVVVVVIIIKYSEDREQQWETTCTRT